MPQTKFENVDNYIGTLNEKSLHANLKKWYSRSGDKLEVPLDGYYIDIVRGNNLIEIQTRNFSSIKKKIQDLLARYPVHLVHAIAQEKWLVKLPKDGVGESIRRKSPRHGSIYDILDELVSFPSLLMHDNFTLEILFIKEEEVRKYDRRRGWRKHGWVTHERRLLDVIDSVRIEKPHDLKIILPTNLPDTFTTEDIALARGRSKWFAQKMVYCLKKMGVIEKVGSKKILSLSNKIIGSAHEYRRKIKFEWGVSGCDLNGCVQCTMVPESRIACACRLSFFS